MMNRLVVCTLLLVFCLCLPLMGNETAEKYFPSTLGSYWIYEDQEGKELKRTVIEGEEIAEETYHAFSYEPELKDWINYMRFMRPELFNVNDKGITFSVKEGVEKAVNARLSKEMDFLFDAALQEGVQGFSKPNINITVESEDNMQLLLTPLDANEEWDVLTIKAKVEVLENGELQGAVDYTIVETGIILGAEKVETAAGTYEDCLKVKYKTETTVTMDPNEDDMNPPGETVTTVWFAPNVGIVKIHQKVGNMFLDMLPTTVGLPFIIPQASETTLELKEFKIKTEDSATTIPLEKDEETLEKDEETLEKDEKTLEKRVEETSKNTEEKFEYFRSTLDSFWIYEDQDGKELKRTVIEGEEIAGETYHAFNYEPELKDWIHYMRFMRPELFNVSDKGITLFVKEGVEKAVKARLTKELDMFIEAVNLGSSDDDSLTVNITVEAEDDLDLLFTPITISEEWDVFSFKVQLELIEDEISQVTIDYAITESGIVLGTETVETPAGTFENCLKVKYQTETTVVFQPEENDFNPPGETGTTIWYAPNVGIVKIHQKSGNMFLDLMPDGASLPVVPPSPKGTTLELKEYQIKAEDSAITIPLKKDEKTLEKRVEETFEYFPSTLDSFWIYEDQDGEELKRTVVEGEEIAEETYHAFSYEPELKDWANFSKFIRPQLFKVSNQGITLIVKEEVEKAVKRRLSKEMEALSELIKIDDPTAADELTYSIKVEAEEDLKLLSIPKVLYEEWDAIEIESSITFAFDPDDVYTVDFTIIESGMVEAKETVKTSAGTFENCLKVVYRTETSAVFDEDNAPGPDEVDPPGETITTVWYAPNVGIVKYQQQRNYTFLELIPDDDPLSLSTPPETRILELKKYEIKKTDEAINEN